MTAALATRRERRTTRVAHTRLPTVTKGIVGHRGADDMERAMRAARDRTRGKQRQPSRAERSHEERVRRGIEARQALAGRIGADKEPKAARAGAKRAEKRELGPRFVERWLEGPSSNWAKDRG